MGITGPSGGCDAHHRTEAGFRYRSPPIEPGIAGMCGASGRGLAVVRRRCRLAADNHNGELRGKCGDCADGGEQWSQDNANGGDGHRNLHERVAVLVLHNDALDVAFVDQVANLIDQVAAQHLNLFNEIIEAHIVDYVGCPAQVPKKARNFRDGDAQIASINIFRRILLPETARWCVVADPC